MHRACRRLTELARWGAWKPGSWLPDMLRLATGAKPLLPAPSAKRLLNISGEGPPRLLPKGVLADEVGWKPRPPPRAEATLGSRPARPDARRGGKPDSRHGDGCQLAHLSNIMVMQDETCSFP